MRTQLRALILTSSVALLALAGCDKKDDKKEDENAKTETKKAEDAEPKADDAKAEAGEAQPEATAVLVLGAAKISTKDEPEQGMELAADGSVSVGGEVIGKLSTDGKLSGADGTVMMTLGDDGSIRTPDGKAAPFKLTDDGMAMDGPDGKTITISFADDGSVKVEGKADSADAPEFVAEGCTGAMARTCALAFTAYMLMMPGEVVEDVSAAEVEAAPG